MTLYVGVDCESAVCTCRDDVAQGARDWLSPFSSRIERRKLRRATATPRRAELRESAACTCNVM